MSSPDIDAAREAARGAASDAAPHAASDTAPDVAPDTRRPRWVFGVGEEPDPRFSLANERTFLAWLRTSMALIAAAVAIEAVTLPMSHGLQLAVSLILLAGGTVIPVAAWVTRCQTERAMRTGAPLPNTLIAEALLAVVLIVVAVLFAVSAIV